MASAEVALSAGRGTRSMGKFGLRPVLTWKGEYPVAR